MSQWYSSSPTAYSPADVKFSDKIATSNPYHLDAHKEVARFPTSSLNSSHDGGCGTADSDKIAQQKTGDQEFPTHTTQHTPGISMYDGLEVRSPPAIPLKSPKRQSHGASDLIPLHDHATGEDPEFPTEVLKQQPFTRRRKVIIIGALCLLLAVAVGAALGAVFGTRRKSGSSRPSTDASSSPTTGTNPSTTSPAVHSVRTDSSIAAVSFVDESNTMQYRLYFQDAGDGIRKSSYNASGGKWYLSNPSVAKDAKPGSPLAAASLAPNDLASDKAGNGLAKSKPPGPITTIYYLDKSNVVHEIVTRDSGATWQNGSITERNIVANEGSRLSATFHSLSTCENCPNTRLMVYQSIDGQLQLLNGTIDGQESQSYALNTTAVKHTGLAVTLRWKADFIPGIRIYYQAQNGDAVAQWWEEPANWALQNVSTFQPAMIPDSNSWQNRETSPMGTIPLVSELGIFTSPTTLANSNPALMEALASPPGGSITTIGWSGEPASGKWIPFATPPIFSSVKGGSKVDANSEGRWYLQDKDGNIREFYVDMDGTTFHEGNTVVVN